MSVWLGARRQKITKAATKAGYLVEVEPIWEHRCKPPLGNKSRVLPDYPVLSDGAQAEAGTLWRCECGRLSEVYVPDERKPGLREWRQVDGGRRG